MFLIAATRTPAVFIPSFTDPPHISAAPPCTQFMRNPARITIGRVGQAAENVTQEIIWVKESEKVSMMVFWVDGAGAE